jgi:hypothetical protein
LRLKGFKLKKNNTFVYVPRYAKDEDKDNSFNVDSKFSKYRESAKGSGLRGQWGDARAASRNRSNREINTRLLIIVALLIFAVLWIFDFDLSIFFGK